MARPRQTARHRMPRRKSQAALAVAAGLTAMTLTAGFAQPVLQQTADAPACYQATCHTPRVVWENPLLTSVVGVYVPGSGYTDGDTNTSWIDGGLYDTKMDEIKYLNDKSVYPGVMGNGAITGQQSVAMGADGLVSLIKQTDPNDQKVVFGVSQGSMVITEALIKLKEEGYSTENLYVVLYSDPYTPVTGLGDRFGADEQVLDFGVHGDSPDVPAGVKTVRVIYEFDKVARMPKYKINVLAQLNADLSFNTEHAALSDLDFGDPLNKVTVDGDVTTVILHSKLTPIVNMLRMFGIPSEFLKPLDDVVRSLIVRDIEEPGEMQFMPDPAGMVLRAMDLAGGLLQASQSVMKLATGQPVFSESVPPTSTPTQDIVDDAIEQDGQSNGLVSEQSVYSSARSTLSAKVSSEEETDELAENNDESGSTTTIDLSVEDESDDDEEDDTTRSGNKFSPGSVDPSESAPSGDDEPETEEVPSAPSDTSSSGDPSSEGDGSEGSDGSVS